MEIVLGILVLLVLSRGGGSAPAQHAVNPVSYTQSPNAYLGGALNMGGALSVPILSSALNGLGRPLTGGFGLTVGGPQSDPNFGNPGSSGFQLGMDFSPGVGHEVYDAATPESFDISQDIITSYQ